MTALSGARAGEWNWLRRLTARAAARDLTVFVVPGLEIARAHGLDLGAAGLRPVATPRHAAVLLVVGDLPDGLRHATAVVWAQMTRPRAILALGAGALDPLPGADVAAPLGQAALVGAVAEIRRRIVDGAFGRDVADFDVAAVRTATTYTCPMHPEIVRDEPGQCPICGMDLVTREEAGGTDQENQASDATHGIEHHGGHAGGVGGYTCPMHAEVAHDGPGSCPICGMDLVPRDEDTARGAGKGGDETPEGEGGVYSCPMHPEIVRAEQGQCPLCGMDLVPREQAGKGTQHGNDAHGEEGLGHRDARREGSEDDEQGYTCPMHPEVTRGAPGSCPICGMDLMPHASDYSCPMHPEIVRDEQGNCPICGMDLVPREEVGGGEDRAEEGHDERGTEQQDADHRGQDEGELMYTCPMHAQVVQAGPGSCPICGMELVPRDETTNEGGAAGADVVEGEVRAYTCPMHPEIARDEPGSCPRCGMDLIPRAAANADRDADNGDHGRGAAPDRQAEPGGLAATDGHPHAGHQGHGDQSAPGASGERQASAAEEPGGGDEYGSWRAQHRRHGPR